MSIKENFYYSKKERRGIAVLLTLILLITITPFLYSLIVPKQPPVDYSQKIAELERQVVPVEQPKYQSRYKKDNTTSKNNNKVYTQERVGQSSAKEAKVQPKRNNQKGDRFVEQKVEAPQASNQLGVVVKKESENYTIDKNVVEKNSETQSFQKVEVHKQNEEPKFKPKPAFTGQLNINTATAEEFAQLKGLGPVLSKRIVNFRTKLGGFVSVHQVGDTFGVEQEVFQQFQSQLVLGTHTIKKHNLNTETTEQLAEHPYISKKLASQIVNFREKVKPYQSFEDVERLYYLKNRPDYYKKIKPYVTF